MDRKATVDLWGMRTERFLIMIDLIPNWEFIDSEFIIKSIPKQV